MPRPGMSVVFTINNRTPEQMENVFSSFIGQEYSQMVIVLDRPEQGVAEFSRRWWDTHPRPGIGRGLAPEFVEIIGDRGWLGPARAWNAGFARVKSELIYMISSEVIQEAGNCSKAIDILSGPPAVVFGFCRDDGPVPLVTAAAGQDPSIVCSSAIRRPLGFIWAMPTWLIRATGGFDETFMSGYWYDDDDFTFRIWKFGVPYIFDDSIRGVHQHHDRASLTTPAGQAGIQRNLAYIRGKHGHEHPWDIAPKDVAVSDGLAIAFPKVAPDRTAHFDRMLKDREPVQAHP